MPSICIPTELGVSIIALSRVWPVEITGYMHSSIHEAGGGRGALLPLHVPHNCGFQVNPPLLILDQPLDIYDY